MEISPCLKICPVLLKMKISMNVYDYRAPCFNYITEHLQSFEAEFKRYFPKPEEQETAFVRNQFSTALDELQEQFCDLQIIRLMLSRK